MDENVVNIVEEESSDNETSKVTLNKEKRGPLNRNKVNIVEDEANKEKKDPLNRNKVNMVKDESSDNETPNVMTNKILKGPIVNKFSDDKTEKRSLKRSRPQVTKENDTEFSSDNPEQFRKKNLSFPATVGDWAGQKMIHRHINNRRSTLNLNEMPEYQDTTTSTNNRIKAHESELSFPKKILPLLASRSSNLSETPETQDTIQTHKPNSNNKRAKKGKQIGRNVSNEIIDADESELSLLEKNIELLSASGSSNLNEIPEIQDITAPTTACKLSKRAKKGNHIDHNNQDIVHKPKIYTLLRYISDTVLPNLNWTTRYQFVTLTHLHRNTYDTFILLYKLTENFGTSSAYLRRSGRKRKVIQ
ncbi:3477_t:CDS:2 [Gigaspora rosea]|nr:3477_t:CDS:2 [Gigaspora rosea]